MSQNVNLIRQAMLEQNPATLGALGTELFQRDPLCNDFRGAPPLLVSGVVPAAADTGDCVYLASASGGTMTFAVCDPSNPLKMPAFGIIEHKPSSTSAVVRPFGAMGEYESSGLTAGTVYVVGTDGALAKFGGSNYPTGLIIQNVGVALSTTKLLMFPGYGNSVSGGDFSYLNSAVGTALTNSTTETTLLSATIPANTLRAGSEIDIVFGGIATATNSTDTLVHKLYIGGSADLLGLTAVDVANNDVMDARVKVLCTSTTNAYATGYASIGVPGTATGKAVKGVAITIDATVDQIVAVKGTWSVASASNSCRGNILSVRVRR